MREKATGFDIYRVMTALEELWSKHPGQRLGQLLLNLARDSSGQVSADRLWNLDEEDLLKCIRECDW